MKIHLYLVLAVGLSSVAAKSLKHGDKKHLFSESNDSLTNHNDPTNNNETEQNNVTELLEENQPKYEETVNIIIAENNKIPIKETPYDVQESVLFDVQENVDISLEEDFIPVQEADYFFNDLINKDPNEIMDTASGFVPIPIFRRQKPRRQNPNKKATRRYNRRPYPSYPYNRYYFYPYYRFYRPSSLRYYY